MHRQLLDGAADRRDQPHQPAAVLRLEQILRQARGLLFGQVQRVQHGAPGFGDQRGALALPLQQRGADFLQPSLLRRQIAFLFDAGLFPLKIAMA
jgi:hypothetical protein